MYVSVASSLNYQKNSPIFERLSDLVNCGKFPNILHDLILVINDFITIIGWFIMNI